MEEKIVLVLNEMSEYLSIAQMKKLQEVIIKTFAENEASKKDIPNDEFLKMFLAAKQIEGCSERTIKYYKTTVEHLLSHTEVSVRKITTEEIRDYLSNYQKQNNCSNVTIDNVRRNISSFFSWLEEEDYILKSPMKRIHKIKTKTVVKCDPKEEYDPEKGLAMAISKKTIGDNKGNYYNVFLHWNKKYEKQSKERYESYVEYLFKNILNIGGDLEDD